MSSNIQNTPNEFFLNEKNSWLTFLQN